MSQPTAISDTHDDRSLRWTRGNVRRSLPGLLLFEAYYRMLTIAATH